MSELTVTVGDYQTTHALKRGDVALEGYNVAFTPIDGGMPQYFRRMVRELEFDVCELAISTYLTAREAGVPVTAIPIFPVREFPHRALVTRDNAERADYKWLEGERIGVRAYTVTTGMWARGVLSDQLGIDLSSITWVINDEEHVKDFPLPANVDFQPGADLGAMLRAGDLAAGIGIARPGDGIVGLLENREEYEAAWHARGIVPINHTVVVTNSVLERDNKIAKELYDWLSASASKASDQEETHGFSGLQANISTLECWLRFANEQGLVDHPIPVETLFAAVE